MQLSLKQPILRLARVDLLKTALTSIPKALRSPEKPRNITLYDTACSVLQTLSSVTMYRARYLC